VERLISVEEKYPSDSENNAKKREGRWGLGIKGQGIGGGRSAA